MKGKFITCCAGKGWSTISLMLCILMVVNLNRVAAQNPTKTFVDVTANQLPGLPGLSSASVGWADYDGDGLVDVLVMGYSGEDNSGNGIPFSKLFHNTGKSFEDVTGRLVPNLPQVGGGSVAWADYDGDKKPDFIITGARNASALPQGKLFHNTSNGFEDVTNQQFPGNNSNPLGPNAIAVRNSSVAWGDYDNDGRPDLLIMGARAANGERRTSYLFHNDGNGFTNATVDRAPGLPELSEGALAWGDYDRDGWLDFVMTGTTGNSEITQIYHNDLGDNGPGFHETRQGLPGVYTSAVAWGDYDNDGRLDLLLAGATGETTNTCKIYHNVGNDVFADVTDQVVKGGLPGLYWSALAWGDYDRDGRLDFLLTGGPSLNDHLSRLYHNMGPNAITGRITFDDVTASTIPGLPGVTYGSVTWADYDNDKRLDFFITGSYAGRDRLSRLYHNEVIPPCQELAITQQPASGSAVCAGGSASTSVSVSGQGATYQWYKDGAVLNNQTSATLTLDFIYADNAGIYKVVISGGCTSLTSTAFSLSLSQSLTITQQPASGSAVCTGGSVSTSVGVSGSGATYQWYKDGTLINGQTSASLSLTNLQVTDAGSYSVVISGGCTSLTSTAFSLTVNQGADLTLMAYARPTTLYGSTPITMVVEVDELRGVTSTGPLVVKVAKDARLSKLSLPASATSVGGRAVDNQVWRWDEGSDAGYYLLSTEQSIGAEGRLSFGLEGLFNPGNSAGTYRFELLLEHSGVCETVTNNTDGDRIDYFP